MLREAVYAVLGLVGLVIGLDWTLSFFDDPREPRRVQPSIPLIGHLIGLAQNGTSYYSRTSKETNAEIYTIPILNHKFYISNTTRLIPLIQKSSKTLSFRPFMQLAAKVFGDCSDEAHEVFGTDWTDGLAQAMHRSLAPGPHLDEQNLRMGARAIIDVDELADQKEVKLLEWVRHAIVQASSCGVYGQNHPMREPKVEAAFWTWHEYMSLHMMSMDLRKIGYAAREIVFDAYRDYYRNDVPAEAAQVVHERTRLFKEANFSKDDIDKNEATFTIAVFSNTAPTMFWSLWELFSRPEVLEEVREELISQAVTGSKQEGFTIDVAALKQKCPLLLSVYQETQRMRLVHASIRKVTSDTMLDGQYMLKAGNFLQMPGNPIHMNQDLWGEDASVFDPYRFVSRPGQKERPTAPQNAFAAWGAAPYLCPARQFATTEILILLALLAMRVDFKPVGTEKWDTLETKKSDLASVQNPNKDPKMRVIPREEWSGKWSLQMGESKTRVSLASG